MGQAGALAAFYAAALATGDFDDQRALGKVLAADPTKADLDVEGRVFRTKVAAAAAKQPDEGTPTGSGGPAFLHFPGMKGREEELLKRMKEYI